MELASKPAMLLCDEVTSGLDPQSEDEIVTLLHGFSRSEGRTVISVTHSLRHLGFYDSVLVLYSGIVAYQGPPGVSHPLLSLRRSAGPLQPACATRRERSGRNPGKNIATPSKRRMSGTGARPS